MKNFYSTKTYGHNEGLSCVFRQWKATHSHCSTLHGYAISVKIIFECDKLDERNWVYDFGGLKPFKVWLHHMFDHTVLVAEDDPLLPTYQSLPANMVDLRVVPAIGCERFAEMAFNKLDEMLNEQIANGTALNPTVRVHSVEVFEHGANSAIHERTRS